LIVMIANQRNFRSKYLQIGEKTELKIHISFILI